MFEGRGAKDVFEGRGAKDVYEGHGAKDVYEGLGAKDVFDRGRGLREGRVRSKGAYGAFSPS